jgi:exodeoxyribonuclease V alpha subunit
VSAWDDRLEGELIGFTYQAADSGFAVARVRGADRREVIAVGPIGHVSAGQHLAMVGKWTEHSQYGRRFKVDQLLVDDPKTILGLERYLSSASIKGLGPEFAKRVVDRFGLDTLRILDEEPEKLQEVSGIGPKRAEQILAQWSKDRLNREVLASLRGLGIGQALANRILERYGKSTMGVVSKEPYRLASEIRGVGFRTADRIALIQGISRSDPARAEAAVVYLLEEAEGQGHCFVPEGELLTRANHLAVPREEAAAALLRVQRQGRVVVHPAADPAGRPVYSPELERAEARVAEGLRDLVAAGRPSRVDVAVAEAAIRLTLNSDQKRAVEAAFQHGLVVITGGPGTGKTTIVRALVHLAALRGEAWLLTAPTGRAARRLAETTGQEAKTLHRLLEFNPRTGAFTRDLRNPLPAQAVLVDEASMVDIRLMESLLAALPSGCRLIFVGDADQLPSVGPGRVLGEMVSSGEVPVATLTQVYRQAALSGIVRNAWRINGGEAPESGERDVSPEGAGAPDFFIVLREEALQAQAALLEIVSKRLPAKGFDPLRDVQVLTPMHNGLLGTEALNERLQGVLNPSGPALQRGERRYRQGDRVIQVRNDYDNEVFNGETGRIVEARERSLLIDFEGHMVEVSGEKLDDVELAYAISIHKSQGSEYPAVVVAMHRSHRIMLRRNLLYTAITRARKFCCVVGDPWAIETAVTTRGGDERWTRLADRLLEAPGLMEAPGPLEDPRGA